MIIEIKNTSSPGASFTKNTNEAILKIYKWICDNKGLELSFKDFRKKISEDTGLNDNNNRNIYPLLKNGGLAYYEKNQSNLVDNFYTKKGIAYAEMLDVLNRVSDIDCSDKTKQVVEDNIQLFINEIVYDVLQTVVRSSDANYIEPIQELIMFLLEYEKVSKIEFAYLIYECETRDIKDALKHMRQNIIDYRNGMLDFEVKVEVRNDVEKREQMNSDSRKEDLGFLSSYGYLTNLLSEAGLVEKKNDYYVVIEEKRSELVSLGGFANA